MEEVQPDQPAPGDAAATFERGSIDTWTIWDPYYALYETRSGVRVLAESRSIAPQYSFLIASRPYVESNLATTRKVVSGLSRNCDWAAANQTEVSQLVSNGTGLPYAPTLRGMQRYPFKVLPIEDVLGRLLHRQSTNPFTS